MFRENLLIQILACVSVLIYSTFSLHITTTNNRDSYPRRPIILDNNHRNLNNNNNNNKINDRYMNGRSISSSSSSNNINNNNNFDILDDSSIIYDDGNIENSNLPSVSSIQFQHHPQQLSPSLFELQQQQHQHRIEWNNLPGEDGGGGGGGGDGIDGGGRIIRVIGSTPDGHFNNVMDHHRHHSNILNSFNSNVNDDDLGIGIKSMPSIHTLHHYPSFSSSSFPSSSSSSSSTSQSAASSLSSSSMFPSTSANNYPSHHQHQLMMTNQYHHRPLLASYLLHNNHHNTNNDNINNINGGRPKNYHLITNTNVNSNQNTNPAINENDNVVMDVGDDDEGGNNRNDNSGGGRNPTEDISSIHDYHNKDAITLGNGNNDYNNNAVPPKSLDELFGNGAGVGNDNANKLHHNQDTISRTTLDIRLQQQKKQQQPQHEQQQQQQQQTQKQQNSQQLHSNKRSSGGGGMIPSNLPQVTHSQLLLRSARGQRQYDVPQIECPPAMDGMERFACPTPDRQGRYRCIDDHVLCDGFIDCPEGEDEDRQACMFYKTTKAHLDVLADALLRWARGR